MSILASADASLRVLRLPLQQDHSGCKGHRLADLLFKSGFGVPLMGLVPTFFPVKLSSFHSSPSLGPLCWVGGFLPDSFRSFGHLLTLMYWEWEGSLDLAIY